MNNTTHSVKAKEIEKKWYILDAANNHLVGWLQKQLDF